MDKRQKISDLLWMIAILLSAAFTLVVLYDLVTYVLSSGIPA